MKLLCLANSKKEGGRCVAGILLDQNDKPIFKNGQPIWIRPVCKANNGQVPIELCDNIEPLDIIEFNEKNTTGTGYQSENTTFDEKKMLVTGKANKSILNNLYGSTKFIFENKGKAVHEDMIEELNHSLILINTTTFKIIEKKYPGNNKLQIRLEFDYENNSYDLPVTDINFLNKYNQNKNLLNNTNSIDVVLSLGGVHNTWYNKLVATILY